MIRQASLSILLYVQKNEEINMNITINHMNIYIYIYIFIYISIKYILTPSKLSDTTGDSSLKNSKNK